MNVGDLVTNKLNYGHREELEKGALGLVVEEEEYEGETGTWVWYFNSERERDRYRWYAFHEQHDVEVISESR